MNSTSFGMTSNGISDNTSDRPTQLSSWKSSSTTTLHSTERLLLPPSTYIWPTTLIVVVAVGSYLLLSLLLCILYRCARRHGAVKKIACRNPCASCPRWSCLDRCVNEDDEGGICAWWKRPAPTCGSVFDRCCPNTKSVPKFACPTWRPSCLGSPDQPGCMGNGWCKSCFGASRPPPTWCKSWLEDACCGYGDGNCRFLCLECKVRARTKPGLSAESQLPAVLVNTQYPPYPGMPFNYQNQGGYGASSPSQPYYWNVQQPNSSRNFLTIPSSGQVPPGPAPGFPLSSISGTLPSMSAYPPNLVPSWIPPRPVFGSPSPIPPATGQY